MKSLFKFAALGALAMSLAACGRASPSAGHESVLTYKPMFFGHGGVDPDPIKTGSSYIAWTTSDTDVNMNPTAFDISYQNMMSSDGIPLSFNSTLTLQVTDSVELVAHFSGGEDDIDKQPAWYVHNIQPVVNQYVRDAFKGQTMLALAIETSGSNAVEKEVQTRLEAYIAAKHIPVKVVNYTLGHVMPPQDVSNQRTKTAEETQRQQTELQTKIAEDNRKAAEVARASADNAYRENLGLSPEQFVELQRIDMMKAACVSKVKCTFVVGNGTALVSSK